MAKLFTSKTFTDRLNATKAVFSKALEDARVLSADMAAEISNKEQQIATLNTEISSIKAVESDTLKFINNLEKLV